LHKHNQHVYTKTLPIPDIDVPIISPHIAYPHANLNIKCKHSSVNISIIGHNCTLEERKAYAEYDKVHCERKMLVQILKSKYPEIQSYIGGAVSIDCCYVGKESVLQDFTDSVLYFGDSIDGNDSSIAAEVVRRGGAAFSVSSPQHTLEIVRAML